MDWKLFVSTFVLIFVAELPDKTAFAALLMATRGNPYAVFIGVALAFVIQTVVAVLFGKALGMLPPFWVHLGAGLMFLIFAAVAWRRSGQGPEAGGDGKKTSVAEGASFSAVAWTAFLVIFIAEWGDLTQLATASLVARENAPGTIFFASISALWAISALAVFAGYRMKTMVNPKVLDRVGAVAFAGVGLYFIFATWVPTP